MSGSAPAQLTEEFAVAMGFSRAADIQEQLPRLIDAISAGEALTRLDWTRALLAVEIAFVSDVVGSGRDWRFAVGIEDDLTLGTLRRLQKKIVRDDAEIIGHLEPLPASGDRRNASR